MFFTKGNLEATKKRSHFQYSLKKTIKIIYLFLIFIYLFYFISFLLTINLKLIIVHVEIKIVNKETATKRTDVVHGCRTFKQSDVMLIRKGKRKKDN